MTTNLISNMAYSIVDPISPSLWGEALWSRWMGGNSTLATFYKAACVGAELHEKSQIFPQLPRTNLKIPMVFSVLFLRNTGLVNTRIGNYVSEKLDTVLQAAHVGLMYGDYAAGKKLTACVRLLTWAYFQIPEKNLPQAVHKIMQQAIIITAWVNVGVFFWRRPILAAATAVTVAAVALSLFVALKNASDAQVRQQRDARWGMDVARKLNVEPQFHAFVDRPRESLTRLFKGQPVVG